ncbi:resolvase [Lachnospiraceae bacterium]|nr:resolvase [Lachnospiraceae bacterium]GKH41264.1 resolvase [Lachnospiraceae bacterium]
MIKGDEKWNAIYARQSLDKKDSISIEIQSEKARALYPEESFFKEYADKGYSGKNMNRPKFIKLMEDIKKGCVKRVIVYRMDRFSRSLLDFCDTWELLSGNEVEFISVNERFDTSTPMGKAMLFILMVFAQLERETIAERVTDNYYARSGLGHWPGGEAPTGFDIVKVTEKGATRKFTSLTKNEYMAYIEQAFCEYATNPIRTLVDIGNYLYNNVPGEWSNTTITRMFRNPAYVKADEAIYYFFSALNVKIVNDIEDFDGTHGALLVGKQGNAYDNRYNLQALDRLQLSIGSWEGLVESNIWIACQEKMKKNVKKKNNGKGKYTWLSGLLKCGYCGKAMVIYKWERTYGQYIYFTCSRRNRCQHQGSYPKLEELENEVSQRIIKLFAGCKNKVKVNHGKMDEIKNSLATIDQKIQNFMSVIGNGASEITIQYINKEVEMLNNNRNQLLQKLSEVQHNVDMIQVPKISFALLSFEDKKIVAASIIKKIKVFENKIEIEWKI